VKQRTNEQAAVLAVRSGQGLLSAGDFEGAISQFPVAVAATSENAKVIDASAGRLSRV
jgi:hypothetical protein